jgi:hypothetical protein
VDATLFQDRLNPWTPIELTVILKDLLYFSGEPGIFSFLLACWALTPGVIATFRDFERFAEQPYRILLTVFCNKRENYI